MEQDKKEQAMESLSDALYKAISYHSQEYDMTYQEIIGCLEVIKMNTWDHMLCEMEDEDDGDADSLPDSD